MDIIHVAIAVTDLDEMRSFYGDLLGLEETRSFTFEGVENVYFGNGGAEIQLRYDPDADVSAVGSTLDHVALGVEDVESAVDRVRAAGVPVLREPTEVQTAQAKIAFVEDPEGNAVEFVERLG